MDTLDEQLSRLIIENQSEDGSIDISDQRSMKDEILALLATERRRVVEEIINHFDNIPNSQPLEYPESIKQSTVFEIEKFAEKSSP